MKKAPKFNVRFLDENHNELTHEEIFTTTVVGDELAKFHADWVIDELGKIEDEDMRLEAYNALTGVSTM